MRESSGEMKWEMVAERCNEPPVSFSLFYSQFLLLLLLLFLFGLPLLIC